MIDLIIRKRPVYEFGFYEVCYEGNSQVCVDCLIWYKPGCVKEGSNDFRLEPQDTSSLRHLLTLTLLLGKDIINKDSI